MKQHIMQQNKQSRIPKYSPTLSKAADNSKVLQIKQGRTLRKVIRVQQQDLTYSSNTAAGQVIYGSGIPNQQLMVNANEQFMTVSPTHQQRQTNYFSNECQPKIHTEASLKQASQNEYEPTTPNQPQTPLQSRNGRQANRGSLIRQKAPIMAQNEGTGGQQQQAEQEALPSQFYQQMTAKGSESRQRKSYIPRTSNIVGRTSGKPYMATLASLGFSDNMQPGKKQTAVGLKGLQFYIPESMATDHPVTPQKNMTPNNMERFNKGINKPSTSTNPRGSRFAPRTKLEPIYKQTRSNIGTYSRHRAFNSGISPKFVDPKQEPMLPVRDYKIQQPKRQSEYATQKQDLSNRGKVMTTEPPNSQMENYQNKEILEGKGQPEQQFQTFAAKQPVAQEITLNSKESKTESINADLPIFLQSQKQTYHQIYQRVQNDSPFLRIDNGPPSLNDLNGEENGLKAQKIKRGSIKGDENEKKKLQQVSNIYCQQVKQRAVNPSLNQSRIRRISFMDDLAQFDREILQKTNEQQQQQQQKAIQQDNQASAKTATTVPPPTTQPSVTQTRAHAYELMKQKEAFKKPPMSMQQSRKRPIERFIEQKSPRKTPDYSIQKIIKNPPTRAGIVQTPLSDPADIRPFKSVKMQIKQVHNIHFDDNSLDDLRPLMSQSRRERDQSSPVKEKPNESSVKSSPQQARKKSVKTVHNRNNSNELLVSEDKSSAVHMNNISNAGHSLNRPSVIDKEGGLLLSLSGQVSKESLPGSKAQCQLQSTQVSPRQELKLEMKLDDDDDLVKQAEAAVAATGEHQQPGTKGTDAAHENMILSSPTKRNTALTTSAYDATPYFKEGQQSGSYQGTKSGSHRRNSYLIVNAFDKEGASQTKSISQVNEIVKHDAISDCKSGLTSDANQTEANVTEPNVRSRSEQKQYAPLVQKKFEMIQIENVDRKRVTQINTSMNAGQILHSHLEQNFLGVSDQMKKHVSTPCNEFTMELSNKTSQDRQSYNRESLRASNINSINYQPFKNESDLDYSSVGDQTCQPFADALEQGKKSMTNNSIMGHYTQKRQVQKAKTNMLIVVDENQETTNLEYENKSVGPPNKEKFYRRGLHRNPLLERADNPNLHPKYQKKARSTSRRLDIKLQCFNRTTIRDYQIQCMIGQGAFGTVQRATLKSSGQKVAIKQYERTKLEKEPERVVSLRKEMNILSKLEHDGIMRFIDSFDSGTRVNLVVEYINGNNLYQYIRKMPESRIRAENDVKIIFKQILESVQYMHEQNVVHRDLKLENILIDRETKKTKLIDFGFATIVRDIRDSKLPYSCGTPIYMCPLMAQKKEHLGGASDVWALGVILYILLTGKMPFHSAYEDDLFRKISTCKYRWPTILTDARNNLTDVSQGAKNLVRRIFTMDQNRRPTAAQLLKDPWLKTRDQFEKRLHSDYPSGSYLDYKQ